jgi:hypothetical protein
VAEIAETQALSVAAATPESSARSPRGTDSVPEAEEHAAVAADWRPKRLVRTVLGSIANSKEFGKQMEREAKRRRFGEAKVKAFLGDGLPWNWSIQKAHFKDFTPILDFIHVLSYLFVAAKAVHGSPEDAWDQYLAWMRGGWRGEIAQVLDELRQWQTKRGDAPEGAPDQDPRVILATTIGYLENNAERMKYPEYRQAGMPVTTAWMESLVKEMNYRVKGTEMFWNNPAGAEAILQVRAAALCDDQRLDDHLTTRPGCPFTRRPSLPRVPRKKIKS